MNFCKKILLAVVALLCVYVSSYAKPKKYKSPFATIGVRSDDRPALVDTVALKMNYFFSEAVRQKEKGNYAAAVDLLTECYYLDKTNAAVAFEFADIYDSVGDEHNALQMAHLAAEADPKNIWYKIFLAEKYLKNKRVGDAIQTYEQIEKLRPDLDDIDYRLAGLCLQTKQYDKTLQALNRLEKKIGIDASITSEKYHMYQMQGKRKKATAEMERLCRAYPMNIDYRLALSEVYLSNDSDMLKAEQVVNEADKIEPNNLNVLKQKLRIFQTQGKKQDIQNLVSDYVSNSKVDVSDKMQLLTESFSVDTDIDHAESCMKSLVEQYPANADVRSYYSAFLMMQKKDSLAEEQLKEIIKIIPYDEGPWKELISIYMFRQDSSAIDVACDSALACIPNSPSILSVKAMRYGMRNDLEKAKETYLLSSESYKLREPGNYKAIADNYMFIGDMYSMMTSDLQVDSALAYYEKSYKLNPNNPLLQNNYAYFLSVAGRDLDLAERMSGASLKAEPNNVSYLDTYAWIFFKKKDYVMAKMFIQQALDKGGESNPVCLEHMGDILYVTGDEAGAMEWWNKAKSLGGGSRNLYKKIETGKYVEE